MLLSSAQLHEALSSTNVKIPAQVSIKTPHHTRPQRLPRFYLRNASKTKKNKGMVDSILAKINIQVNAFSRVQT